ncbi:MAG TPA: LacI family DNA-binding transcriptional regulator [Capsulimonadaceae bacterium]|jgi:LacI family transcriptional regulator
MFTIKDVARRSGVSTATVSYVLNNGPRVVRPHTRERVLNAVKELNYRPSAVARGLNSKRMDTIGVVMLDTVKSPLDHLYYRTTINGIVDALSPRKKSVTLFNGNLWRDEQQTIPTFCDGRCDGLIVFLANESSDLLPALKSQPIPFVVVGECGTDPTVSNIDIDNVKAARLVVDHLIACGHRRIAFFMGDDDLMSSSERYRGYRDALAAAGLDFDPALVVPGLYDQQSGYERAVNILPQIAPVPTAIFACSDLIALGVIDALRERGMAIPGDMSLAGIDGLATPAYPAYTLTTVDQHLAALGATAAEMVSSLIEADEPQVLKIIQPCELKIGNTVATI